MAKATKRASRAASKQESKQETKSEPAAEASQEQEQGTFMTRMGWRFFRMLLTMAVFHYFTVGNPFKAATARWQSS